MGQDPEKFREDLQSLEEAGFAPPPEDEWPPLYHELPYEAQEAMRLFYILPVKIDGMAGYTGKDLSVLDTFFTVYEVPVESRKCILDLLIMIINKSVHSAHEKAKAEAKKRDK
jgi:hypothetical protein